MKIKPEHVEHMAAAMRATVAQVGPEKCAEFRQLVTPKRYRWDLARGAGLTSFMCDTLYPYAEDKHIDTALRSIVASIDAEKR
jgi:hypothetical protein